MSTKTAAINMRVEASQHALLTKAASVLKIDRSSFIMDVACREAENVLLDQRLFQLNDEAFSAFTNALEAPVKTNVKLEKLLSESSSWE
ncbi:MAG: DUF1778 domain-containing protein [Thiomicrospira sp.]|nr:MAG: DUF1778 domain-containing protein [Thiomicrospira sp.]